MHKVHYDNNNEIVVIEYLGSIYIEDVKNGSREAAENLKKYQCDRVLVDCRDTHFNILNDQIHALPETFSAILKEFGFDLKKIKRALLVREIDATFSFMEGAAVVRGYVVKVFDDADAARSWLLSDKAKL